MLWPKKSSYKEFDNKKNSCGSKIPLPRHNFSNGPSLTRIFYTGIHRTHREAKRGSRGRKAGHIIFRYSYPNV